MSAILLGWNPQRWNWADYDEWAAQVQRDGTKRDRWSVGRHVNIAAGSDAWLLVQGKYRGLIGRAIVRSEPYEAEHYSDPDKTTNYVEIDWLSLLPIPDRIPPVVLNAEAPGVRWDHVYGSGRSVPVESEAAVHALWERFGPQHEARDPGELPPGLFPEGAVRTIVVNRYERDPRARAACVEHWGLACIACGLDFASVYGEMGKGFIHVHHLTPVSQLGPDYQVDPIADLRPLCPNCHAMVHTQDPPMPPDDLAARIRASRTSVGPRRTVPAQKSPAATCPDCGRTGVPIMYGAPGPEMIAAAEEGRIALGGCVIYEGQPTWTCSEGHEWRVDESART
ncbi:HNH endonuclease [Micromonospora sp. SL4-19]|uniref:HNH endonuclease n=1 Tax=Micromonospora sp. SL4-19 TaxID=3399129 RepID=UPI003A4E2E5C